VVIVGGWSMYGVVVVVVVQRNADQLAYEVGLAVYQLAGGVSGAPQRPLTE